MAPDSDTSELIAAPTAARILGLCRETIVRWCRGGATFGHWTLTPHEHSRQINGRWYLTRTAFTRIRDFRKGAV